MIGKLSFRNASRSIKDYLIYFITTTLSFSLIFAFNLILFSDDIIGLSKTMSSFQMVMTFVTIIILFVIAWLVNYTMRFLFLKRSKEFGMFELLGIQKKKIIKMFLMENLVLGGLSLLASFIGGIVLSQFFSAIIMNIFEMPYQVHLDIHLSSILLTLVYFAFVYLFILFRSSKRMKKMKVYDLLYLEKQNESKLFQKKKNRVLMFLGGVLLGILGLSIFYVQFSIPGLEGASFTLILFSMVMMIVSIYFVTVSFMDFCLNYVLKHIRSKYSKMHLFLVRMISTKIRSMGFTLGTLSFLVLLTFVSLNVSNIFQFTFENQTNSVAPYDITIYDDRKEIYPKYLDLIKEYYEIEEQASYTIYHNGSANLLSALKDSLYGYQVVDCYMKLSDYNRLLTMRNEREITLGDSEFYVHSHREVYRILNDYLEKNPTIDIDGYQLKLKGITDKNYATQWSTGSSFLIVVPDEVVENMDMVHSILNINVKGDTDENFSTILRDKIPSEVTKVEQENGTVMVYDQRSISTRGAVLAENRSMITIFCFSLMFLAFIFTAVVGTILAIQSLSDSEKYRSHYKTLYQMGLTKHEINRLIRKQLACLFYIPVIYPIFMSFVISFSLNNLFWPLMTADYSIYLYWFIGCGLFLVLYTIYYIATYFGFKSNLNL